MTAGQILPTHRVAPPHIFYKTKDPPDALFVLLLSPPMAVHSKGDCDERVAHDLPPCGECVVAFTLMTGEEGGIGQWRRFFGAES